MREIRIFLLASIWMMLGTRAWGQASAGDYRSAATGNWNSTSTWETFDGSSWVAAGATPSSSNGAITIRNGHTVTVTAEVTIDQVTVDAGGQITLNSGVTLTIANGTGTDLGVSGTINVVGTLTINSDAAVVVESGGILKSSGTVTTTGTLTFNSGGNYQHNFTTTAGTIPTTTWNNNSTCEIIGYTSNTTAPSGLGQSFHHFTWNCPAQTGAIDARSTTITVKRHFKVTSSGSGSFAAKVKFNGTDVQTISSAAVGLADSSDLTIDNSSGVTPNSDLSIRNLTFVQGNLISDTLNLTINGAVTGADSGKCIVTNGAGRVKRRIAASQSFQFPIAPTTTSFSPVTIALASGDPAETFSVRVDSGVNPNSSHNNELVQKTWHISEQTSGGNSATLTFQWKASEEGSSFTRDNAAFYRYNSNTSTWEKKSEGTLSGTGSGPFTLTSQTAITEFSPWSPGNGGGLPVELMSFSATAIRNDVDLRWRTATETHNYGFEIERRPIAVSIRQSADSNPKSSTANQQWAKVGFVPGAGTSASPKEYSFIDKVPVPGRYAYRIKQIDNDGTFKYYNAAEVEVGLAPKVFTLHQNYPNPFNPSTTITFTLPEDGRAVVEVHNVLGQTIANIFDEEVEGGRVYQAVFDGSKSTSGVYFARLHFGNRVLVRKILLMK